MTPPELDAETKARIEAEEAYRAQVRAKHNQVTPPLPAPAQEDKGSNVLVIVLVLAIIGVIYIFFREPLVRAFASSPVVGTPVGLSVEAQDTPDNYGQDLYITLNDENSREIASAGQAIVEIYSDSFTDSGRLLWNKRFDLTADNFSKGTRGQGAFKRDAIFAKLGRFETAELGSNPPSSLEVRAWFTPTGGGQLPAKTKVSLN